MNTLHSYRFVDKVIEGVKDIKATFSLFLEYPFAPSSIFKNLQRSMLLASSKSILARALNS